ncbi:hypothetical protein CRG98_024178 [Punica granatum]|uniref:Uncharacterized protein n=1 Tax=Punica granatum TaxID=22663 RepID=A0A2I0JGM1_PUNGR|nr:hypothetical protein CRG98_024178 [Punica granatum]
MAYVEGVPRTPRPGRLNGPRPTGRKQNEDARHRIYNRKVETPKVGGMGRTIETRTRMGRSFPSIDRGVSDSLMLMISVNHGMTTMPLSGKACDVHIQIKDRVTRKGLKRTRASRLEPPQIGPRLES